jgi:putative heme-binding domain-containing protein
MPRCLSIAFCGLLSVACLPPAVLAQGDPHVAATDPLLPAEQLKRFRLPPGFEIQLVAAEPDVQKPINMCFDARGRLLVTQSVEYPFPAKDGVKTRDRVSAYEDFADDGKARKVSVVLRGLNIPIGLAPMADGLLVYSIPHVLRCRDTDGDGTLDRRDVILRQFGYADTHGMVNNIRRGIDGWIYACHGFSNTSTAKGPDGKSITMQSGNTFRFREDGSQVEYFTHGQVNPFGLAFDPLGNLFSADCHSLPAYQLVRGAWYPSFGKPHDGLGYGPAIMSHQHGSTGLSGIVYYAADHFPPEYRDTLFIGNPVTHRINHDKLKTLGSTYQAIEQPDFLVCDDPWFRPVDLQLGLDGALYVADFYNRIIGHYEVPLTHPLRDRERGRIWRIVYRGKDGKAPPPKAPPDLAKNALEAAFFHPNLAVRSLATNVLIDMGRASTSAGDDISFLARGLLHEIRDDHADYARADAVWVIERLRGLSEADVRLCLTGKRPECVHAIKAVAERPAWEGKDAYLHELVRARLADKDAFVRRAAAEALGRHPSAENVEPLLKLWEATPAEDTHLIHTVRIALREHLLAKEMYAALALLLDRRPAWVHRAANLSLGVRSEDSARYLLSYLGRHPQDGGALDEYLHHAARYIGKGDLSAVYEHAKAYESASLLRQRIALRAVHRALEERNTPLPEAMLGWSRTLAASLLASADEGQVRGGLELARDLRIRETFARLRPLAAKTAKLASLRSVACEALGTADASAAISPLAEILADGSDALDVRRRAAAVLAGIGEARAREALVKHLPAAPAALAVDIALGLSRSREGGLALLAAIEQGKASARLLQERAVMAGLEQAQVPHAQQRVAKLTAGLPAADERIAQLIEARRNEFVRFSADAEAGRAVYKKICAACHKLGGEGNKIGPELDGIGLRGFERLLEDILDPSRTVDQAFRSTQILTKGGRTLVGLKLRTDGEVLVLANNEGKEERVPLSEIERNDLLKLSPMPSNIAEALPPADFYHLVKYLLAQQQPAKSEPPK